MHNSTQFSNNVITAKANQNEEGSPVLPIPEGVDPKTIPGNPVTVTPYRYASGGILVYAARFIKPGVKKRDLPYCWWRYPGGREEWKAKQPLNSGRPLLNLPNIIKRLDKPIYVGEGEKVANALRKLFPNATATTSIGGSKAAAKSDWSVVKDRDVILFLDLDIPGEEYGEEVYQLCKKEGAKSIKVFRMEVFARYATENGSIIECKRELPGGYDIADAFDEGWTTDLLLQLREKIEQSNEQLIVDYQEVFGSDFVDEEWPDPLLLTSQVLPIEPFNKALLPEPLQEFVADITHRMKCPIEFVAIPLITMFGSLIGASCGIRPKQYDNWTEVPNLWGCIVGSPGTYKSPALRSALAPLKRLEQEAFKKYKNAMDRYELDLESFKDDKKLPKPEEPICQRFQTNDTTIEKLSELLNQNPRGILYMRDELMGFFATLEKPGNEAYRSFFLEGWNGLSPFTVDRITRGTIHCENVCISILGGTQPSKLIPHLERVVQNHENDGFLQRFQLLVCPDDTAWEYVDLPPNIEAQEQIVALAEKILEIDFTKYGASKDQADGMPYFRFLLEAQHKVAEWLTDLNEKIRNKKEHSAIAEHLSKYAKLMPALALIFHIIEIAAGQVNGPIPIHTVKRAMALCDVLESHMRRIYGMVIDNSSAIHKAAEVIVDKIINGSLKDRFSLRDVYRHGWKFIRKDPEITRQACDYLVQAGYLKRQVIETTPGHCSEVYRINPKLKINHG